MPTTDYLINDVALYLSKEKEATFNTASSTGSDYLKVATNNPAYILPNYEITTDAGKPGNGHEFPTYQCITYVTHPAISITDQMNPFIGGRLALRALGGTIDIGWRFADAPLAPRVGGRFTYGSGDADLGGDQRVKDLFWNDLSFISSMNVLGLPAAVVPVGLHEGLPVGVQIVGSRYREDMCLDAAEAIERKAGILTRQLWERR